MNIVRVSPFDWADYNFRVVALKEARRDAKASRTRVVIKVGSHHYGYVTRAIVDGRFYVGKVTRFGGAG